MAEAPVIIDYVFKKFLTAVPTLLLVMLVIFALVRAIPGDPALLMVGDLQDPNILSAVRIEMGLDKPLFVQFGIWLGHMLQGDWGVSLKSGEPVYALLMRRFSVTASIVLVSVLFAALIGGAAGVAAAKNRGGPTDRVISGAAIFVMSTPAFWTGLLALYVFAIWLGAAPVIGIALGGEGATARLSALILPILVLTITESAVIARIMRAATLEALSEDYVLYARSKGLGETTILFKHVLKNAASPTLTLVGLILGNLLGGAAVIETVFTLPGLGSAIVEAIYGRDYPVIQGVLVFITILYLTINLVVDILYPLLDPRVEL